MKLSDIAILGSGYQQGRHKYYEKEKGKEIRIIDVSTIVDNRIIDYEELRINIGTNSKIKDIQITKENDILIKTNGNPNKSVLETVVIDKRHEGCLFKNSFCLVRCNDLKDVDYVYALLSNRMIQQNLWEKSNGSNKTITIDALKDLEIIDLDKEKKEAISKLNKNIIRQKQIINLYVENMVNESSEIVYKLYKGAE